MSRKTIKAYDLPPRVAWYDADMAMMHPNREKMAEISLEVLPFPTDAPLKALDLGAGTGYFTQRFLLHFPNATVVAFDGAPAMMELAKARLGNLADRVTFKIADFRQLTDEIEEREVLDVVFSTFAFHHLIPVDKEEVVRQSLELLKPGGWVLNSDIVVAEDPDMEKVIQDLRIKGIVKRAQGMDPRFRDAETTRTFLDEFEANEGDQPVTVSEDLDAFRRAGVKGVTVFWLEYREMVYGGQK